MSKQARIVLFAIPLICMAAVAGASALMGGCDKLIECTTGSFPMRCHWAFVACAVIGGMGLVSSACALVAKGAEARRVGAVCTLAAAAACFLCLSSAGIGLCQNADMACHQTALVVRICAGAAALAALVQIAKADDNKEALPKMKL